MNPRVKDSVNELPLGSDKFDGALILGLDRNDFKVLTNDIKASNESTTKALEDRGVLPKVKLVEQDTPVTSDSSFNMSPRKTSNDTNLAAEQLVALNVSGTEEIRKSGGGAIRLPVRPLELPEVPRVVNLESTMKSEQLFRMQGGQYRLPENFNSAEGLRVVLPQNDTARVTSPSNKFIYSADGMAGATVEFSTPAREVVGPDGYKYVRVEKLQWLQDPSPGESFGRGSGFTSESRFTRDDKQTGVGDANGRQMYAMPTKGNELYLIVDRDNIPIGYTERKSFGELVNSLRRSEDRQPDPLSKKSRPEGQSVVTDNQIQSKAKEVDDRKDLNNLVKQADKNISEYRHKSLPALSTEIENLKKITDSGYIVTPQTDRKMVSLERKREEILQLDKQLEQKHSGTEAAIGNYNADANANTLRRAVDSAKTYEKATSDIDDKTKRLAADVRQVRNEIKADQVNLQLSRYSDAVGTYNTETNNTARAAETEQKLHSAISKIIDMPAPTEADRVRTAQQIQAVNDASEKWQSAAKVGNVEMERVRSGYAEKSINDSINKPIDLDADNVARVKKIDSFTKDLNQASKVIASDVQPKLHDLIAKEQILLDDLKRQKAINEANDSLPQNLEKLKLQPMKLAPEPKDNPGYTRLVPDETDKEESGFLPKRSNPLSPEAKPQELITPASPEQRPLEGAPRASATNPENSSNEVERSQTNPENSSNEVERSQENLAESRRDLSEMIKGKEGKSGAEGTWYALGDGTGVKVYDKNPESYELAVESFKELKRRGYPLPEIIETATVNGVPAIRMQEIKGETVREAVSSITEVNELKELVESYDALLNKAASDKIIFDGLATPNMIWNPETQKITVVDPGAIAPTNGERYAGALEIQDAKAELRGYGIQVSE